jgi:hypothetical protein
VDHDLRWSVKTATESNGSRITINIEMLGDDDDVLEAPADFLALTSASSRAWRSPALDPPFERCRTRRLPAHTRHERSSCALRELREGALVARPRGDL